MMSDPQMKWYRVAGLDELPEGRVMTVTAGGESMALTHFDGHYAALLNACPHQGGPLGEGTIENGSLVADRFSRLFLQPASASHLLL